MRILKFSYATSAIIFSLPGMCAPDMYTLLLIQNSQISVVTLLRNMDLIPPCLFMYDIVIISHNSEVFRPYLQWQ